MKPYPNPCDTCTRVGCNHLKCAPYLTRFRRIWKEFNSYPLRAYRKSKNVKTDKFRYEYPDIVRRYLEKGPCEKCQRAKVCDAPCFAYWRWWDARMEWLRGKFNA